MKYTAFLTKGKGVSSFKFTVLSKLKQAAYIKGIINKVSRSLIDLIIVY